MVMFVLWSGGNRRCKCAHGWKAICISIGISAILVILTRSTGATSFQVSTLTLQSWKHRRTTASFTNTHLYEFTAIAARTTKATAESAEAATLKSDHDQTVGQARGNAVTRITKKEKVSSASAKTTKTIETAIEPAAQKMKRTQKPRTKRGGSVSRVNNKPSLLALLPAATDDESHGADAAAAAVVVGSDSRQSKSPPLFWVNPTDPVVYNQTLIHCTIRGNPLPLRRHRTARGFVYNPSAAAQVCFQKSIRTSLKLSSLPVYTDSYEDYDNTMNTSKSKSTSSTLIPLTHFGPHEAIALHAMFYLARPKHHFRSSIPGVGRIKPTAPPGRAVQRKVDIDNLAKFVLDSLNGVLYADDHQVVSLICTKCYHDDDDDENHARDESSTSSHGAGSTTTTSSSTYCRGKTVLWLQSVTEHDLTIRLKSQIPQL